MISVLSIDDIMRSSVYEESPTRFFGHFGQLWSDVKGQVLKLETRQVYREPGNPSYEELEKGDFSKAIETLPSARQVDVDLYRDLASRMVDFVRCRPIVFPLTDYLKWEIECYHFNAAQGERIYFTDRSSIFDNLASHDFMVFDRKKAVIHNYDKNGEIQGGWLVEKQDHIDSMIMLFSLIKASALDFRVYLKCNNHAN